MLDRSDEMGSGRPARRLRRATGASSSTTEAVRRPLSALIGCTWPIVAMSIREAAARGGIHCSSVLAEPALLVAQVGRQRPDLCLIIGPYSARLADVIARIGVASRSTRTVILAADDSPPSDVLAALCSGADGWLPLETDSERLVDALRAVARGEAAVPRTLMSTVLAELRGVRPRCVTLDDGTVRDLAPREHDVLLCLGEGLTTAQVSTRLGIGEATVRGYVASAVRRLGVSDRETAVGLAMGRLAA